MSLIDLEQDLVPNVWVWVRWEGQPLGCAWLGRVVRVRPEGLVLVDVPAVAGELRIRWAALRSICAHAEKRDWEVPASVSAVVQAVQEGRTARLPVRAPGPAQGAGGGGRWLASLGIGGKA